MNGTITQGISKAWPMSFWDRWDNLSVALMVQTFKTRLVAVTPKNCIKVKEELPSKLYSKFPHFPCGFLQVLRQGAPQGL